MKLYIKQKVFSWGDKFTVIDAFGYDKYIVEGEVFLLFHQRRHYSDGQLRAAQRAQRLELLALLSDCAGAVGGMELHAEPQVHVQVRCQCARRHAEGTGLLCGFHSRLHRAG